MGNSRLQHDTAFALATALLDIVANCLRDEEKRDCWQEFYLASRAAIEAYESHAERMRQRLGPSVN